MDGVIGTHTMSEPMLASRGKLWDGFIDCVHMQVYGTKNSGAPPHRKLPVSVHCLSQEVTESAARLLDVLRHIGRVGRKQAECRKARLVVVVPTRCSGQRHQAC
jgi:hypothetical protein